MADITLKTDYKDDVLDTSANTQRKYQMIQNDDGTVSFVDVTEYSQVGDSFGAADVNAITENLVNCFQSVSNGKSLVASAITDKGVTTSSDATFETMANNIEAIPVGKCIYLGTGTRFDVRAVCANNGLDYTKLTTSNFIVGASGTNYASNFVKDEFIPNTLWTCYMEGYASNISHAYNASTGTLSVNGYQHRTAIRYTNYDKGTWQSLTQTMTCFAYLVYMG